MCNDFGRFWYLGFLWDGLIERIWITLIVKFAFLLETVFYSLLSFMDKKLRNGKELTTMQVLDLICIYLLTAMDLIFCWALTEIDSKNFLGISWVKN